LYHIVEGIPMLDRVQTRNIVIVEIGIMFKSTASNWIADWSVESRMLYLKSSLLSVVQWNEVMTSCAVTMKVYGGRNEHIINKLRAYLLSLLLVI
jgi:hypothetical protein